MRYLIYFTLVVFFVRCNDNTNNTSQTIDSTATKPAINQSTSNEKLHGCYRKITGRDTLLLQLKTMDDAIAGTMVFDNYEKDSSHGTVTGTTQNGLIVVWYNFYAEGMRSVVQHAFKPFGDQLILGTGAITYRKDSAFISDLNSYNFQPENTLTKVDCTAIQAQLSAH